MPIKIMKSSELKNLKQVNLKKKKRVLLINPKKEDGGFTNPHNGLAILAAILKKRGHEVLVVDYSFVREDIKGISFFVGEFKPDIVGISIYTSNANGAEEIISKINSLNPKLPIMVGGPHATIYYDLLQKNKQIDYIFVGEAELTIIGVVENGKKEKKSQIIKSDELVDLNSLPFSDFKSFYKWETIRGYPIMTSRGCPNQCSFCISQNLARKWRFREAENCIEELKWAKGNINSNISVIVMDDNPMVIKERFYKFLEMFADEIGNPLTVINTRADSIDDKFLELLKKCKCNSIMVGVEHRNPEVFQLINKGETLEQVEQACYLIKKHKIKLGCSFMLGVPKDNLERVKENIRFFKKIKPDGFVTINPIIPFRGTSAREWFEKNGAKLRSEIGFTGSKGVICEEPYVETEDFTNEERKKAYYMFLFEATHPNLRLKDISKIFSIAKKYSLYKEFFCWLPKMTLKEIEYNKMLLGIGLNVYRKEGLKELIRRYKIRNK